MRKTMRFPAALIAFTMIAAGCGGEASDDAVDAADNATTVADDVVATTDAPDTTDAPAEDDTETDEGDSSEVYDDPRDGIFDEFQASFVRDDPFSSLDAFCLPHDAAADRADSDHPGLTADTININHLRSKLEQLADIGFAVPIGDPIEVFDVFTTMVNEECGGVRGRQINLSLVEVDALPPAGVDVDALRNTACIEATEDEEAIIVINSTGFQGSANLCLVEEHDSIFISTQGQPNDFMERGNGRLISLSPSVEEGLGYLFDALLETGVLEGKTIGLVTPDTPGQIEPMQDLQSKLEAAGLNVAVFDVIGCGGSTSCTDGVQQSVANMVDAGVDVMFPGLNVVSLPGYINELITQGYSTGDIQFYQSDFNSQAGDLVSSKVVAFGGEAAGELYNGTLIVDEATTGAYRIDGYVQPRFNDMCLQTYADGGGNGGAKLEEDPQDSSAGMVVSICALYRIALRGLYDAGDNPGFQDVVDATSNLGPIDINGQGPGSLTSGDPTAPDAVHTTIFQYPCTTEIPGFGAENTCILPLPEDVWVWIDGKG